MRVGVLAVALAMFGCATTPSTPTGQTTCSGSHRFYVLNHGWHTGVAIAGRDLVRMLPALAEEFGDGEFVEIGWGDEGFYRAPRATLGLALRALFWPTATVLQVVKVPGDPRRYFSRSEIIEVTVTEEGHRHLVAFVAGTFARSREGAVEALGPGLYGDSRFYRARGSYSMFNTCNTWVAEAVAASGFPISTRLALTAGSVMSRLGQGTSAAAACVDAR